MNTLGIVLLSVCGGLLIILIALCIAVGGYFFKSSFGHKDFFYDPKVGEGTVKLIHEDDWIAAQKWEEISLESFDHLKLIGEYLPAVKPTHRLIIFCHGYHSCAFHDWSGLMHKFHDHGYNVLGIDERAHGKSEGKYFSMGDLERHDIHSWVEKMVQKDPDAKIILMGRSMGAHIVMMSMDSPFPDNVKGFIADAGYQNLKKQLLFTAKDLMHLHGARFLVWAGMTFGFLFHHLHLNTDTSTALVNCEIPGCFIHGEADDFVPCSNLAPNYNALKCADKEMYSFPGAYHVSSEWTDPKRFDAIVYTFCDNHTK
jgi:alpha-beta hydrolase superfamily lysophospholipase